MAMLHDNYSKESSDPADALPLERAPKRLQDVRRREDSLGMSRNPIHAHD